MGAPVPGPDVQFDFSRALDLARRFYQLASTISTYQEQRDGLARTALTDWQGIFSQQFADRMRTSNATAAELEAAVRATAGLYAKAWQLAAEKQKRVEWARHCQKLDNSRSEVQKLWDDLAGDSTKFPPMPGPPPEPAAPEFAPTTDPYQYP